MQAHLLLFSNLCVAPDVQAQRPRFNCVTQDGSRALRQRHTRQPGARGACRRRRRRRRRHLPSAAAARRAPVGPFGEAQGPAEVQVLGGIGGKGQQRRRCRRRRRRRSCQWQAQRQPAGTAAAGCRCRHTAYQPTDTCCWRQRRRQGCKEQTQRRAPRSFVHLGVRRRS